MALVETGLVENLDAFQAAYAAAGARRSRGEPPVPYVVHTATAAPGAGRSGRGFGVELEFDVDPSVPVGWARQAIARDLQACGLIRHPVQRRYHANRGDHRRWRFERDATVHGEVVSPLLVDEPSTWDQVSTVCDVIRRHGGRGTERTGGHVHVSVADFGRSVANHVLLLEWFRAYEDTLYRLAHNPQRPAHRGTRSCAPNPPLAPSWRTPVGLALYQSGHTLGLNFAGATGRRSGDHVEFRLWDSTLDPAVIQAHVRISLGLADAAARGSEVPGPPVALGTHRAAAGAALEAESRNLRSLIDRVLRNDPDREQVTALFAVTSWQARDSSRRGRPGSPVAPAR